MTSGGCTLHGDGHALQRTNHQSSHFSHVALGILEHYCSELCATWREKQLAGEAAEVIQHQKLYSKSGTRR